MSKYKRFRHTVKQGHFPNKLVLYWYHCAYMNRLDRFMYLSSGFKW